MRSMLLWWVSVAVLVAGLRDAHKQDSLGSPLSIQDLDLSGVGFTGLRQEEVHGWL